MDMLWWILLGVVAGFLTKVALPREDGDSVYIDVIAGAVGACLGGYMYETFALAHGMTNFGLWNTLIPLCVAAAFIVTAAAFTTRTAEE